MQIHHQLATLKKENSSIIDYSHQFTSFANTLATIDQPLKILGFLVSYWLASNPNMTPLWLKRRRDWSHKAIMFVIEASQ